MNPFSPARRHRADDAIHTQSAFRSILERERARSDRTGQEFSLVVFDAASRDGAAIEFLKGLAEDLVRRVRVTDEVGWFGEKSVGVALLATSAAGASRFVEKLAQLPPLDIAIYTYPTKWMPPGPGERKDKQADGSQAALFAQTSSAPRNGARETGRLELAVAPRMPMWKRALDIVGSLVGLVLLSPVFLLVAAFVKIVSPGPAFYRQERVGRLGRPFTFWKFRTMHAENDATGHQRYLSTLIASDVPMTKLDADRDPRIIPCGKILRATCLDELPQLFNVLKGEMSLVGPRPCLPYEAQEYLVWHARRFDSVPGMTGLWQVSGKNRLTFKQMVRLDIEYARNVSPWLDVKILLKTTPAIAGMLLDKLAARRAAAKAGAVVPAEPKRAA